MWKLEREREGPGNLEMSGVGIMGPQEKLGPLLGRGRIGRSS